MTILEPDTQLCVSGDIRQILRSAALSYQRRCLNQDRARRLTSLDGLAGKVP
jgi:hypothetical protein